MFVKPILTALVAGTALFVTAAPADARTAPGAPDLSAVLSFDNPADPWLSEKSGGIFASVWTEASSGVTVPGIGLIKASSGDMAQPGWVSNALPMRGDWNGLSLTKFTLNGVPNSGVGSYALDFADAAPAVVARLDALGFPVDTVGAVTRTGDTDCGTALKVEKIADGSRFIISFAC